MTLNHVEVIEGLEAAIAVLLEKMAMSEFYAGIYAALPSRPPANSLELQRTLNSALPELYAAVIIFAVKARAYFEAGGTFSHTSLGDCLCTPIYALHVDTGLLTGRLG